MSQVMQPNVRETRCVTNDVPYASKVLEMCCRFGPGKDEWIVSDPMRAHAFQDFDGWHSKFPITTPSLGIGKCHRSSLQVNFRPTKAESFAFPPSRED